MASWAEDASGNSAASDELFWVGPARPVVPNRRRNRLALAVTKRQACRTSNPDEIALSLVRACASRPVGVGPLFGGQFGPAHATGPLSRSPPLRPWAALVQR